MQDWQWIAAGTGVVVGAIGALLALSNPHPNNFEAFAIEQIQQELCPQVPLGFAQQCPKFVADNRTSIGQWVQRNTQRHDYVLFSHYQTQLSLKSVVPESAAPLLALAPVPQRYHLESIGLLGKFVVYETRSSRF